ncbi:type IX secretion system sortase PorU [Dyadobacter subterraneus]|uniref:type IX secretion system sortase PorU n=1 Tax=Dyadobacter subterraneus TaxID=2773304 RepID=UPI0036D42500
MHWSRLARNLQFITYPAIFCWIFLLLTFQTKAQESSVLATGTWYKLAVTESGVYKIDANLLKSMGVDISTLVPDQIKIYGNGGSILPQKNSAKRNKDLIQNTILVKGEEDGKFDAADAVYFYAEGPNVISYDSAKANFIHQVNIYSDTTFYFLTYGNGKGLRIQNKPSLSVTNQPTVNQYDDYWFHELESVNLLRSGRDWWGEYIGTSSTFTLTADLPDIIPSSNMIMLTSAIGTAQVATKFQWQLNGQSVGESSVGVVGTGTYDIKAQQVKSKFGFTTAANSATSLTVGVTYNKNGQSSAQAYLDYIGLQVKRTLSGYDKQQFYRFTPGVKDTVSYQIQNIPTDWSWWNISDPALITAAVLKDGGNNTYTFTENKAKTVKQYIGFTTSQTKSPVSWQRISNQNLQKYSTPDLLIITAKAFETGAKRLADFRSENDGLESLVVTTDQIYNEFSGGKTDISAVRDFVRLLYKNDREKLKYLLLFGDATYDYKNLLQNQTQSQRNNWVPVYESRESLNPVYTYSSDDYFGFMEDEEGYWIETNAGDYSVEIGIGRLPVKTADEAKIIVDKLIHYASSPKSRGSWQNTIKFVADDGDGNIHQEHADALAKITQNEFLSSRIFLDAYPQTTTSQGQKVPAVNAAIKKSINEGTLILNYTGHGGTSGWAEEQVLTLSEMQTARGYDNLPLLITATCDFGRYDDPGLVSGAELMVLSPRGAAIGTVSTTRPVYSSTNFTINKAFYESLIQAGTNGRMGEIFRMTKNASLAGSLNRNFTLIGDPSMKLARAQKKVLWNVLPDTLRALEKVVLNGKVGDENSIDKSFQGTARVIVYDKQTSFRTLGNEGDIETYNEFRSKLFDGTLHIKDGQFVCEFVMPKDIDYRTGTGRVDIYALSEDSLTDASAQLDILVGGSAELLVDNTPPKISAYLNSTDFHDGDTVDGSSILFLKLSDENGINVSKAGIGHDITITLNDTLTLVLNDYYTADLDNFKSGTVRYPFENLNPGNYTIRIKVWDTYTNSSELTFRFQVGLPTGIKLNSLTVFPNPFDQDLSFELNQSRADDDVEIVFSILLNSGQILGSYQWQYYNSESVIKQTIPPIRHGGFTSGTSSYIYVVKIRSLKDNSVDTRSGKLLRLR